MFDKKQNPHRFVGKTNRIVEGTTIKGDIISQADFRLDGKLIGNFQSPENCNWSSQCCG
jgi:cytoskeletal protein CcmA (bactofilin family)